MPQRATDERTFNLLRRMREERGGGITLAEFKAALREQGFMLLLDQEQALATLPRLLGSTSAEQIRAMLEHLRRVAAASGPLGSELKVARQMAEEALRMAEAAADDELIMAAEHELGATILYQGDPAASLAHLRRCVALYDPEKHGHDVHVIGKNQCVAAHSVPVPPCPPAP